MKDRKINFGFSYPSNMANFELFHWTINFMACPKYLRSLMYDQKLKINYQIFILRIFFKFCHRVFCLLCVGIICPSNYCKIIRDKLNAKQGRRRLHIWLLPSYILFLFFLLLNCFCKKKH